MNEPERVTPMMRQFLDLKKEYSDCVLLFRAGDFYETFFDDAKIASKVLDITLTKRADIPMAGVPFHSIMPYIKKLLDNNYKVAICDQLEDPKQAKGLVKRGITRILTPGTILEDEYLSSNDNNFIMCIYPPKDISENYGIAIVDITTGEFLTSQARNLDDVKTAIKKYSPNEIILKEKSPKQLTSYIASQDIYFNYLSDVRFNKIYANEILKKQFGLNSEELGLKEKEFACIASGALLFYIYKLQKLDLSHINKISYYTLTENMILDSISLRNLEITENLFLKDKSKTLYGILNKTKTASGARLLKKHLTEPLTNQKQIEERLDSIQELSNYNIERNEIMQNLEEFSDIERIISRISSGIANPRDLNALRIGLSKMPEILQTLTHLNTKLIQEIKKLETFPEICNLLENAITENAPAHTRDIGYIKPTYNEKLAELHQLAFNSKDFLSELEETERLRTGITTLKIKYNKIFGYFIEIPRTQSSKVPTDYIPTQTLANNQRYTKPELKEKEGLIASAEEKIKALEIQIFNDICLKIKMKTKRFQEMAKKIAQLDVLCSNSYIAQIHDYKRPKFSKTETKVLMGRNPLVERFVDHYVPNDTIFTNEDKVKIITGPNMSGKSTYLRQNALISIMAQAGMFIPAESAILKIYDRIFTRIGAHDELSQGQSTFMVEMSETANILNNTTEKSLVLLDEIGRGTSTYDGLAIAWAVVEDLNDKKTDTIFATHYHQLNKLQDFYEGIVNYQVLVREEGEEIEFIHKIIKGGTDKSYGIYVGKIAGIPQKVLDRAKDIQLNIEEKEEIKISQKIIPKKPIKKTDSTSTKLDKFL
ncbi:MAG: DNA mismatch repair protein MutS [Nanoarchaeota archaeon]